MVTWNINGTKIQCPACYEELSTEKYQQIVKEWEPEKDVADRDFFRLFCMLTDTDYAGIIRTPENEVSIWNAVSWYVTRLIDCAKPEVMEVNGKVVEIKTIGELFIGQAIHIRRRLEKSTYLNECIAGALAIGIQPLVDGGEFDIKRVEALEREILAMPITRTYGAGFFLLQRAENFGRRTGRGYRLIPNSLKRILSVVSQR